MRQYAADNIELSWLAIDFKDGLAAGTFVQEGRTSPAFSIKPAGAVSKVVRVYNSDRSGTVTITVDQESQLHQDLKTVVNVDRIPASRGQVGNMVLVDNSSSEEITWINAFIMTEPDKSRAVESATFAWIFAFEDFTDEAVTTLSNPVGG